MAADPLTAVLDVGGKLLDKFFPDADAEMKNKMRSEEHTSELQSQR